MRIGIDLGGTKIEAVVLNDTGDIGHESAVLDIEYLMLRGFFMPPGVTNEQVAYYVDVFKKVRQDFDAKAVAQTDHQIRRTMDDLLSQAVAEVKK